ncbi:LHFPL tetraspan subfamily member 2a protein-like [Hydractinia symbiolongicarpus]|uniref:LHFPL tetraspan subfamily member 2a protein-like n=1 Tax=Hydractinia symbiolongicarpus TaxID=13093 RepID=UPI00254E9E5D|nr:LHFPL tetraspan subfamily member 2a protein-like [Hydractinia symbiolongicarpus]
MLFVIVTCRSLFWILCSVGTFMLTFTALATPKWIIAKEKEYKRGFNNSIIEKYKPTLGLYNRCIYDKIEEEGRCIVVPKFALIPGVAWRACIIFLAAAVILLAVAAIFAVISFCKQIVRRKSLMNLAGIMQAIAGILLIVAIILFPLGWDNNLVKRYCESGGEEAGKFKIASCSVGLAYFAAIGATVAAFFCSMFSFVADKAVFSDAVQDEILEGKRLICVP